MLWRARASRAPAPATRAAKNEVVASRGVKIAARSGRLVAAGPRTCTKSDGASGFRGGPDLVGCGARLPGRVPELAGGQRAVDAAAVGRHRRGLRPPSRVGAH